MRRRSKIDVERDLPLLYEWESTGISQSALAERVGCSQSGLSERLAQARRYRDELRKRQDQSDSAPDEDVDLPYVTLSSNPQSENGHYYDLNTDECTVDQGKVRIGHTGNHDVRAGQSTRQPDAPIEGQRLRVRNVWGGIKADDPEEAEIPSEKHQINDTDRAKGVTYVQPLQSEGNS